jgi:hypothetical protein
MIQKEANQNKKTKMGKMLTLNNIEESHLVAIKRIFWYLLGTIDLGLWYPKFTLLDLVSYSDADFVQNWSQEY